MGTKSNQIKLKFFFSCEWFTIYKRDPMHESRGPRAKALFIYMIMQSTPEYLGKYLPRWIFWCPWHGALYNGWHCQHLLASLIIFLRLFGGCGSYCFQIRVQASIFELIETAFFSLTFNFSYSPFDFSLWFLYLFFIDVLAFPVTFWLLLLAYNFSQTWLFLWRYDFSCDVTTFLVTLRLFLWRYNFSCVVAPFLVTLRLFLWRYAFSFDVTPFLVTWLIWWRYNFSCNFHFSCDVTTFLVRLQLFWWRYDFSGDVTTFLVISTVGVTLKLFLWRIDFSSDVQLFLTLRLFLWRYDFSLMIWLFSEGPIFFWRYGFSSEVMTFPVSLWLFLWRYEFSSDIMNFFWCYDFSCDVMTF